MPPRDPVFWDGVAWATRMHLVAVHVLFGVIAIIRQNLPLLFAGYSAFDDAFPFATWGLWNLAVAFLLFVVPSRVPFGMIVTPISALLLFWIGAMFWQGAELVFGSGCFYLFGLMGGALFMRSLWLTMVRVRWFQRYVMRQQHG
ncbi:hypothetical protein [Deinococcus yunweiensis]|uniref:hypothetical protein n=1 Tax=Deinococcus yunweiensis TaxID=367282 RepID=UPI00398EC5D4